MKDLATMTTAIFLFDAARRDDEQRSTLNTYVEEAACTPPAGLLSRTVALFQDMW